MKENKLARMINLNNWSIRKKILSIIAFTIVLMIVTTVFDSVKIRKELQVAKQEKVRNLVEAAHGILIHYEKLSASGKLTLAEAQTHAKNSIKAMIYDSKEYFWINDHQPKVVMHAIKSQLNGKDVSQIKDHTGFFIYQEIVKKVEDKGQGYINYYWPKPGSDVPVPKISYVKGFDKWGWIVGTGLYVDDIQKTYITEVTNRIIRLFVTLIIFVLLAIFLAKSITNPLKKMIDAMNNIAIGDANLTQRLDVNGKNELSQLALGFNKFVNRIQNVIVEVSNASIKVEASTNDMSVSTLSSQKNLSLQQIEIEHVSTSMNEMVATIQEVARNAEHAALCANEADKYSEVGKKVVGETVDSMTSLSKLITQASETIEQVNTKTEGIDSILDVIKGIADQTNLLALNAAIEAARAGEQGRGFSVVADEVRNLAKRTQESTEEIQEMIEDLQKTTSVAVKLIHEGSNSSRFTVDKVQETGEALQNITQSIAEICSMNDQIATASEEQSVVAVEMDKNLVTITEKSENTVNEMKVTANSSNMLTILARNMKSLVGQFKLD